MHVYVHVKLFVTFALYSVAKNQHFASSGKKTMNWNEKWLALL